MIQNFKPKNNLYGLGSITIEVIEEQNIFHVTLPFASMEHNQGPLTAKATEG